MKKRIIGILLVLAMLLTALPYAVYASGTEYTFSEPMTYYAANNSETSFCTGWKFYPGSPSGSPENTAYIDTSWENVDLPHDYSIENNFSSYYEAESGYLPGGNAWYRKSFTLPSSDAGKSVILNFDGVYMNATVYVNGVNLGTHPYGYTAFAFDIGDYVDCDGSTENVIAVKVEHNFPSSRWYSGSGIYREVTLTVRDKVHIAYNGISITTPNLESEQYGNVTTAIKASVENKSSSAVNAALRFTVTDKTGVSVASYTSDEFSVSASNTYEYSTSLSVAAPTLWSVDDPTQYSLKTEVLVNGALTDTDETSFGYRYFNFDRTTGFSLNGQKMKLQGVCMHHDQGALGSAAYYDATYRQLSMLKKMGCNAIRTSHNPASKVFIELCSQMGFLVVEEAFDTWTCPKNGNTNDYSSHFSEAVGSSHFLGAASGTTWAEADIKSMVSRDRNEPCVILWSLGNEILEGTSGYTDDYPALALNLVNWVKAVDTTRPATLGSNNVKNGAATEISVARVIAENGGIIGLNYSSDEQFDSIYANYPSWTLYGAETASSIKSRGIYSTTGRSSDYKITAYDYDAVGWGRLASSSLLSVIERDYIAGEFVWTGFDYIGEPTPWNETGVKYTRNYPNSSYFGIIDTAGFVKDSFYLYQSQWNDKVNTLHIVPAWDSDALYSRTAVNVDIYTDAAKVELYLNDRLMGTSTATNHTTAAGYTYRTYSNGTRSTLYPTFTIAWQSGTLRAVAYDASNNVIANTEGDSTVKTSGTPAKLTAYSDKSSIKADGGSLAYITIDVTDESGVIDPNASDLINVTLSGSGTIVGVDNGDQTETSKYKTPISANGMSASIKAFSGKALVIVKSTGVSGSFTLDASASDKTSCTVTVATTAVGSGIFPVSYTAVASCVTEVGVVPSLDGVSASVVTYSDNSVEQKAIAWDIISADMVASAGSFVINGTVADIGASVKMTVTVAESGFAAVLNYSTVTEAGVVPLLPSSLCGVSADGTVSATKLPVVWDAMTASMFASAGDIITVDGTASMLGNTYAVTASVRVIQTAAAENIAINAATNSDIPTLSQSPIAAANPSDDIASLNNGTKVNIDNVNERWTNWNTRKNEGGNSPWVQLNWSESHTVNTVSMWHFTDSSSATLPSSVTIEYSNDGGQSFTQTNYSGTTMVSYTSGNTDYLFTAPVTMNALRITMTHNVPGTHANYDCVGLTEIEVYTASVSDSAKSTAALAGINIGSTALVGFDAATFDYTLATDAVNTVTPVCADNAAVTVLPINDGTVKLLVTSEDGQHSAVYSVSFTGTTPPPIVEISKAILTASPNSLNAGERSVMSVTVYDIFNNVVKDGYTVSYIVTSGYGSVTDGVLNVPSDAETGTAVVTAYVYYNGTTVAGTANIAVKSISEVDKASLVNAIAAVKQAAEASLSASKYTASSYDAFIDAYNDALAVNGDKDATADEVTQAANALSAAYNSLAYRSVPTPSVTARFTSSTKLFLKAAAPWADADDKGNYCPVVECGIIYIRANRLRSNNLIVTTSGRTKLAFSTPDYGTSGIYSSTRSVSRASYYVRAYIRYINSSGSYVYSYSPMINVK